MTSSLEGRRTQTRRGTTEDFLGRVWLGRIAPEHLQEKFYLQFLVNVVFIYCIWFKPAFVCNVWCEQWRQGLTGWTSIVTPTPRLTAETAGLLQRRREQKVQGPRVGQRRSLQGRRRRWSRHHLVGAPRRTRLGSRTTSRLQSSRRPRVWYPSSSLSSSWDGSSH